MATTYSQALLDRAQAYVEQPLTARRYDEGLTEITALYGEITGQAVGTCRQCQYSDFLAVVTAYIREATRFLHPELMADSSYTFAAQFANETIADGRYNKSVTADNLTDEDAKALLKLGYGHVIVPKSKQADTETTESEASDSDTDEDEPDSQPSARETELEQQLTEAKQTIENNRVATEQLTTRLNSANGARLKSDNALKAEKVITTRLTNELAEVRQQLATKGEGNPVTPVGDAHNTAVVDPAAGN